MSHSIANCGGAMNTSKQVNIMIGVVLLSILIFGGYMLNEGSRQATARQERTDASAETGKGTSYAC